MSNTTEEAAMAALEVFKREHPLLVLTEEAEVIYLHGFADGGTWATTKISTTIREAV